MKRRLLITLIVSLLVAAFMNYSIPAQAEPHKSKKTCSFATVQRSPTNYWIHRIYRADTQVYFQYRTRRGALQARINSAQALTRQSSAITEYWTKTKARVYYTVYLEGKPVWRGSGVTNSVNNPQVFKDPLPGPWYDTNRIQKLGFRIEFQLRDGEGAKDHKNGICWTTHNTRVKV